MKLKLNKKIQSIILILVLLAAGYFAFNEFYLSKKDKLPQVKEMTLEDMFKFENKNSNVSEEEFKGYEYKVEQAKAIILANPQALNPSHWMMIARMKKYVNDFIGAEQIYLFLLTRDTVNYLVPGNLADLYANYIYDYENAARAYWEAIKRSTHNAQTNLTYYRNLADIYADKLPDKRKEFEDKCENALTTKLHKDNIDFRTMFANYYGRIGNKEKQIYYLEQALAMDPTNQAIKDELEFLK